MSKGSVNQCILLYAAARIDPVTSRGKERDLCDGRSEAVLFGEAPQAVKKTATAPVKKIPPRDTTYCDPTPLLTAVTVAVLEDLILVADLEAELFTMELAELAWALYAGEETLHAVLAFWQESPAVVLEL